MSVPIAMPHWRAPTAERTRFYHDALRRAGAEVLVVSSDELPAGARGLVLAGGTDVSPRLYGERRNPHTDSPHRRRDIHELSLLRQAIERDIPVLAICRGHELLNVAFGGKLLQHVDGDGHRWHDDNTSRWHEVRLDGPSRLAGIYGEGAGLQVNSRHHQAVTTEGLAPALRAVAFSPDGLVEATESDSHRWVMGVQWHPERPEMRPGSDLLFGALVRACSG